MTLENQPSIIPSFRVTRKVVPEVVKDRFKFMTRLPVIAEEHNAELHATPTMASIDIVSRQEIIGLQKRFPSINASGIEKYIRGIGRSSLTTLDRPLDEIKLGKIRVRDINGVLGIIGAVVLDSEDVLRQERQTMDHFLSEQAGEEVGLILGEFYLYLGWFEVYSHGLETIVNYANRRVPLRVDLARARVEGVGRDNPC